MTKEKVRNIALFLLAGLAIVFFALWYTGQSHPKDDNRKLQAQVDSIQKVRDAIVADIKVRETKVNRLEDSISAGERRVADINNRLNRAIINFTEATTRVTAAMNYRNAQQQKLLNLLKNPHNRDGDALISSLKEKLDTQ